MKIYGYHYSPTKLKNISTRALLKLADERDVKVMDEFSIKVGSAGNHLRSASFFLQPLPNDFHSQIGDKFVRWNKGDVLTEHKVLLSDLTPNAYRLASVALEDEWVDTWPINLTTDENDARLTKFYNALRAEKYIGTDHKDMCNIFSAVTQKEISDGIGKMKEKGNIYQYATTIPHALVYISEPVDVISTRRYVV